MENFPQKSPLGKKILQAAGIVGISAMSLLPSEKFEKTQQVDKTSDKNLIEWTSQELRTDQTQKEVASDLAKEEIFNSLDLIVDKEQFNQSILIIDETISEYMTELLYINSINEYMIPRLQTEKDNLEKSLIFLKDEKIRYQEKLANLKNLDMPTYSQILKDETENQIAGIQIALEGYDQGRKWILGNINDPEYLKRLTLELEKNDSTDINKQAAGIQIMRRAEASDENFTIAKDIKASYAKANNDTPNNNVSAFYKHDEDEIYFPLNASSKKAIDYAVHEYAHMITKANKEMTPKAIQLFSEAFDSLSIVTNLSTLDKEDIIKKILYFSNPTEMYARKKQFDHDLEDLKIKKYKEKFTIKHYLEALELKRQDKLPRGSLEFLWSVKPKFIIKIMNEIAEIKQVEKPVESQNLA